MDFLRGNGCDDRRLLFKKLKAHLHYRKFLAWLGLHVHETNQCVILIWYGYLPQHSYQQTYFINTHATSYI